MFGTSVFTEEKKRRRIFLNTEVVFRPNENLCLLPALWAVDDVRKFLKGGVKANKAKGIRVGFKWRKISGVIDGVAGSFNVQSLKTRVLSREDNYVLFLFGLNS